MYPIMLELTGKKIVIIGGGQIALRKTKRILNANGKVTLVAPEFLDAFYELENVMIITATYTAEQIKEAHLIFACTDSKAVNHQIVNDASEHQWVNDCSQKENSDFYNMSTIEQEEHMIALSSYGKDPESTKNLRKALMHILEKK
ncbi:precorrin-2 dehydrogenase/sirohydrochlorin ferrochelatase family protein [Enterococcus sp. AZ177]|uniref:precorrin-2 dehydrogenase/sirohydrochlorin ferrochelatase family protein n=1 Tax=unclassified Enterococcus TaxID=2608891 RepID=UPI003D2FD20C